MRAIVCLASCCVCLRLFLLTVAGGVGSAVSVDTSDSAPLAVTWERLATMADPRAMVMKALPRRDNHFSLAIEVKVESRMKTGDMYTIT